MQADTAGFTLATAHEVDLLRLSTAGSVDDGKSTLIGRLLYDTKSIFEDQLEAVERASRKHGETQINLALLTDGLRAEREQKITIDVAYRYFATPKRKFIIADTPGHLQYTRNMVTGASTAELAIVLVDARKGILTQSRRHGFIASLLRIPHVVICVNKMDLVDWDERVYEAIVEGYRDFAEKLQVADMKFIPISALEGDNVVTHSDRMPWYQGGPLLHYLETVNVGATRNLVDFRFPVQYVIRPHQDFRGFAGRIASGTIRAGEEVVVLPSGHSTRIRSIETADGPLEEAVAGESVVLTLQDEVDASRGEMIVRRKNLPLVGNRFDALICWMNDRPLDSDTGYVLFQTSREAQAFVTDVVYRIDIDTLHRETADTLGLNDIGRVEITTSRPFLFDPYDRNRTTGSFILIDPHTNATVAAGMITGEVREVEEAKAPVRISPDIRWEEVGADRSAREARNGHRAGVLWFTGLSGAGKTTIARELERNLFAEGRQVVLIDGDRLRHGLCGDLGFSPADRGENIRRAGEVAKLFFEAGHLVLCAFVAPYRVDRDRVRSLFPEGSFFEIHVDCDVETLRARDTKGLYARSQSGHFEGLSGVAAPYEAPVTPELRLDSSTESVESSVASVRGLLERLGIE